MGIFMWAPAQLKWEPIGKFGLGVGVYRNFVWLSGENEVAHCMTIETARELGEWLIDVTKEDESRVDADKYIDDIGRT